jgi:hypothetical protein
VSQLHPEAFEALSKIKKFGLDTWLPGKQAYSRLADTQYTRVCSRIIDQLVRNGYLVEDDESGVTLTLAGENELANYAPLSHDSSRFAVDGLWFQVDTDNWGVAADAAQVRGIVRSGLVHLARTDRAKLARIHESTLEGGTDEFLTVILLSAVSIVTAKYGVEYAPFEHFIGVRAYPSREPAAA